MKQNFQVAKKDMFEIITVLSCTEEMGQNGRNPPHQIL
jgi:hypothetical protein